MLQRLFFFLLALGYGSAALAQASQPVSITSPDGRTVLQLSGTGGTLHYSVNVAGQPVLLPSNLGIETDGAELGEDVTLGASKTHTVHETYRFWGAHATATENATEASVPVRSHGEAYFVDLYVANDGVAVRLRLPAKPGRKIEADRSTWALPGNPVVWSDKLSEAYESPYHAGTLDQLGSDNLGLPITAQLANGLYLTLTEAALKDYSDLAVHYGTDHMLHGQLYADPQGWTTDAEVVQPWRVTVIARNLTELVNTTLVQNLNPPPGPELANAAWIQPERSSWQWLSSGAPVESEQKQWVDWTAELGFEYYLIDEGWADWKGAWDALPPVVAYARSKQVKIWIWVHSKEVFDAASRREYFRRAAEAGVVGVKIDFPPPASRKVVDWYYAAAKDAAAEHLMVDFHGANKPTGMDRTWPNVLTREGVRGHEWHITRYKRRLDADHDVILPFTRYIAGPGDYTPTVFTPSELMGNTWAHELAQSVIFTSPFLCFGGAPATYLSNPAFDVLKAVPPVWDETLVLPGSRPGTVVAEARRSGNRWFVAVINGGDPTDLTIPLDFLKPGTWKSTLLRDADTNPAAFDRKDASVRSTTKIQLHLQPRGGFVAWFRR